MGEQKKKEKKITFSEEIDSSISGFALVITFIMIGIFLLFNKDYFGNETVSTWVQWIFIIVGCLGFGTEVSNMNKKREIMGLDNLVLGIVFIAIWAIIYYIFNHWIANIISFFFIIFGLYGGVRGVIEIIYSINKISKGKNQEKSNKLSVIKDVILLLSEIAGMGLIVVQVLQVIGVF